MAKALEVNGSRIFWMEGGSTKRKKAAGIRSNLVILCTSLLFFLFGSCLFYVWSRIQVIRLGYEISNALKVERALGEENRKLRLEIATLKSCARIEKLAVEELKMTKPKPEQIIVIR